MALYYPPTANGISKQLDAQLDEGVTASVTLNNVTNIQNKPGVLVINRVDSAGALLSSSVREYISYTAVSGSTLTGLTRALGGSTDQDHAIGSIVEFIPDVVWADGVMDALDNLTTAAGALDTTKVTDLTTAQTLTNKTLTSPVLNTGVSGTAVLDEDNMASDSATKLATQQSIKAYVDAEVAGVGSSDGWTDASAYTWVYASASTFTIAGVDLTTTFTKGTRLKFTQTTVKYAVVVSSSFSTNTTVTIAVNTDYTIANAAISLNYYSYAANPQGYPSYFSDTGGWDLEFGGTNASNTTVSKCKFAMIGKTVYAQIKYDFTGDPGTGALTITPTTGLAPETTFEVKGVGRYWNLSAAVIMQVDFDGTDFLLRGATGTAMSDTSPSTIGSGHDLSLNLTYNVA